MAPTERYPLSWPSGWQRTPRHQRERAQFSASDTRTERRGEELIKIRQTRRVTIADAFDRLDAELYRLGAQNALVSSNLELRLNGAPRSNQTEPYENGIAVYFNLKGKPICLACEKWDRAADNIAAIAQHIDALRRIDRYGVGRMEQAFAGYTALPEQAGSWFVVTKDGDVDCLRFFLKH